MAGDPGPSIRDILDDLEEKMRKASLAVSLTAVGLMTSGILLALTAHGPLFFPGGAALPIKQFLADFRMFPSMAMMSAAILLLALLPILRVFLALLLYARRQLILNAFVAFIVLLELALGMLIPP
jgi:hypothetical protein